MTDRVILGANLFVEELNCRKRVESLTLPRLNKTTERFVAGGGWMALDIPMEIESLTATATMKGSHEDLRSRFGNEPGDWTTFYYYERLRDIMAGKNVGRIVTLIGLINEVQQPRVTGKRADMTTYTIGSIILYRDVINGVKVHEIDFDNNSLVMNGKVYSDDANRLLGGTGGTTSSALAA